MIILASDWFRPDECGAAEGEVDIFAQGDDSDEDESDEDEDESDEGDRRVDSNGKIARQPSDLLDMSDNASKPDDGGDALGDLFGGEESEEVSLARRLAVLAHLKATTVTFPFTTEGQTTVSFRHKGHSETLLDQVIFSTAWD